MTVLGVETRGPAVVLTVDRPDVRNAVDDEVIAAFEAALDHLETRPTGVRAVVVTGAPPSFVSGADMRFIRGSDPAASLAWMDRMAAVLDRLEVLRLPVFAAVNGFAYGGGAELILACDVRIAERQAKIAFRQAAMGLVPSWGAVTRLRSLVTRGAAMRLMLTAEPVPADEARALGLVEEVVEPGASLARCLELADRVAETAPTASAETKALLRQGYDRRGNLRAVERRTLGKLWCGPDHREAMEAFLGRRKVRR
ncbi:MAG: enoyl-CoA hydratase/isomerase family protein [Sandaracinaceae bacterium]